MQAPEDLKAWRRERRAELIARRCALTQDEYRRFNGILTALLLEAFADLGGMTVGFCWPFKREFDARFFVRELRRKGSRVALPVVTERFSPLCFLEWWPGAPVAPGVFGLPVPQGTERLHPQALLIPPVGFDEAGFRLGYGAGYFDRTLAVSRPQPLKIAVGFELSRMPTIYPQPHDVPMDFVVTEAGVRQIPGGRRQGVSR